MRNALVERLWRAGCVAAAEEAEMLLETAAGDGDRLDALVCRREAGEPVEWIVGWAPFCELRVGVTAGVYVPRVQTEVLASAAAARVRAGSIAVDLATGSGAVAMVLARAGARVSATELDPVAATCARANGVDVFEGDLDEALPRDLEGRVDVVTANVPYVPTAALDLLARDVREHEPVLALDGGPDGLDLVRRVLALAPRWLVPGGSVLIEIGPDQAAAFPHATPHYDAEGDVRAIEVRV